MSTCLSVIIPIFRVEAYIERCTRSLMEQTLGDIEFIVDAPEITAASAARYTDADAEITTDAMAAPQDFNTISPFGAPQRERKGIWYFLLIAVGILALLALGVYAVMLAGA